MEMIRTGLHANVKVAILKLFMLIKTDTALEESTPSTLTSLSLFLTPQESAKMA
jgi:hypothetical protein